jgi:hypothetical protein
MDGDAKINYKEFELGLKSSLSTYGNSTRKKSRPNSGTTINRVKARLPLNGSTRPTEEKLVRASSQKSFTPR